MRDVNYNPDIFYRMGRLDVGVLEHESNGRGGYESRSWNQSYLRYSTQYSLREDSRVWWSAKASAPYGMSDEPSRDIPKRRGIWEFQIGINNLFDKIFEVNELVLRLYGGGASRLNPLQGGQELTYREKISERKLLLPLYVQIFHGYGENLLDATEKRWGFRAGVGF
jgi:outer membrane phospholipase A